MIKKVFALTVALVAGLAAAGTILYVMNPAPVVPSISGAQAAHTRKPYVVKLHTQWCPVCMVTKQVWSDIERAYSARVNLLASSISRIR
jgi:hypothetical protein